MLSSSIRSMSSDYKPSTASVVNGPSSFCCFKTYLPDKSKNLLGTIQVALTAFWKVPDPNGRAGNPCTSRTQWSGPSVSMEPQSLAIMNDVITTGNSTTCRKKIQIRDCSFEKSILTRVNNFHLGWELFPDLEGTGSIIPGKGRPLKKEVIRKVRKKGIYENFTNCQNKKKA